MEYVNTFAPTLQSPNHTHPEDIGALVAEIAGPKAAWAKVEYSEADASRDIKLIAGEGMGRVVGMHVAEIGGKAVKKWFVADRYVEGPKDWKMGNIPAALHDRFASLKQLLRRPKPLLAGQPFLYHRSLDKLAV